ncbi:MAG: polysaccharide deacetylase, partial [Gordonia sp. (in: high G+C Gram-positive bacteria)]
GPDLAFGPEVVKGGRTQCLEGSPAALFPALRSFDMTWDSSMAADHPGIFWPAKKQSIWEFAIPYVYSPGLRRRQTALDYNFWYSFNGAKNQPRTAPKLRRIVRQTYEYMYDRAFHGNRAPIVVANHFNEWNGNSFNPATADFMRETCSRPETRCVTHQDLVAWLELQDPKVLADLQKQPAVAVDAER